MSNRNHHVFSHALTLVVLVGLVIMFFHVTGLTPREVKDYIHVGTQKVKDNPPPSLISKKEAKDSISTAKARAELEALPTKDAGSMKGYSRSQFGKAWTDVDHNGCDTRDDILNRDMTDKTWVDSKHCRVKSGTLHDPYTGKTLHWKRGGRDVLVDIDHVVALGNAWTSGASDLSESKRVALANDPDNLLAVDGPANRKKGDKDASKWMPDNDDFTCQYASKQVQVKTKYRLWVTDAERSALEDALDTCPA